MAVRASVGAALACVVVFGVVGCGVVHPELRIDPQSYVTYGYHLGVQEGVSVTVEDIRHAEKQLSTIVCDLAFVNLRKQPVKVDLGLVELAVARSEFLATEVRVVTVAPGSVERATLSFRTGLPLAALETGRLKVAGIRLPDGSLIEVSAGFVRAEERQH
jgi:hypothetical protein